MNQSSYRKLEIFRLAYDLALRVHRLSMGLPKFEMYEEGSQIRRSAKSVVSTIVEGFGRRRYKAELLQYLTYARASCDETSIHLQLLFDTGSFRDETTYQDLARRYDELGRKINLFSQAVMRGHLVPKYVLQSSIQHPASSITAGAAEGL